jgi:F-type H+-transporting ATPase subunit a
VHVVGIEFPPVSHLIQWPAIVGKGIFAINKVVILELLSAVIVFVVFFVASRKQQLVPRGIQNVGESVVDFIRNEIILQTMGPEGLYWTPYLLALFAFIFMCNIWEIIPVAQMPVTARFAVPMFLALLSWVFFIVIGIKRHGLRYFKNAVMPAGVPKALYVLVIPIEIVSTFIVRPFSLMLRLFANLLAGHLLLATFAILAGTLFAVKNFVLGGVLPLAMLIAMYGFELLVAVLQAFIFTILTAVYIQTSMEAEH